MLTHPFLLRKETLLNCKHCFWVTVTRYFQYVFISGVVSLQNCNMYQRNILQYQQISWKLHKASWTLPSFFISVKFFACCYSQPCFGEAAKSFHKLPSLITVDCPSYNMNVYGLVDNAWKDVVFLANKFYTGPVDGLICVLSYFRHSRHEIIGLHWFLMFI